MFLGLRYSDTGTGFIIHFFVPHLLNRSQGVTRSFQLCNRNFNLERVNKWPRRWNGTDRTHRADCYVRWSVFAVHIFCKTPQLWVMETLIHTFWSKQWWETAGKSIIGIGCCVSSISSHSTTVCGSCHLGKMHFIWVDTVRMPVHPCIRCWAMINVRACY